MYANISEAAEQLAKSAEREREKSGSSNVDYLNKLRIAENLSVIGNYFEKGIWYHKGPLSANDELTTRSYPDSLNSCADNYFKQIKVRTDELDWFFVDVLIASSNKLMIKQGESLLGDQFSGVMTHGIKMILDGKYLMGLLMIGAKLVKLLILLLIVFFPISIASDGNPGVAVLSLGGIGYFLLSGHRSDQEYSAMKKSMFDRLWHVNRVYSLLASEYKINWSLLERELNDTRRLGVIWASALDTAVKFRVTDSRIQSEDAELSSRSTLDAFDSVLTEVEQFEYELAHGLVPDGNSESNPGLGPMDFNEWRVWKKQNTSNSNASSQN